jgi:glucosamine-6-phosphate deaminase
MVDFQKNIFVFSEQDLAGKAAGQEVEKCIVKLQEKQQEVRIIFAAAPSQSGLLSYLAQSKLIKWEKVVAFHMDEYIGLPKGAPQFFAKFLEDNLFSKVPLKEVHTLDTTKANIQDELGSYGALINKSKIDIVCLGIGENGHIAFNDPPVADFDDPKTVKVVELDEACRIQQVNDGCFPSLEKVPSKAITLTVPALMKGHHLFCVVLGDKKSEAVKNTLTGPISSSCPASILTTHPNCKFYFNKAAVNKIPNLLVGRSSS